MLTTVAVKLLSGIGQIKGKKCRKIQLSVNALKTKQVVFLFNVMQAD